jgi:glycosyltransferase involved in cell wall biosynthesis
MEILLTIAIPTIEQRTDCFNELYNELKKQSESFGNLIEIVYICDNKEMTIGAKRQKLVDMSKGKYIVMWDDDDWIHPNGIEMIMEGLKSDADVISYNYSANIGIDDKTNYDRKVSIEYTNQLIDNVLYVKPDCKNPIKKELINKVKFRDTSWSEEFFFKMDLFPYLKTEYKIEEDIYQILNRSGEDFDNQRRYNLKTTKLI